MGERERDAIILREGNVVRKQQKMLRRFAFILNKLSKGPEDEVANASGLPSPRFSIKCLYLLCRTACRAVI